MDTFNNGTIFRIFCNTDSNNSTFKCNIETEELTGRVFVGIENYVLIPSVDTAEKQDYWATRSYIQFSSPSFPPFIDLSTDTITNTENYNLIFSRVPLIASPTLGDSAEVTRATYALDRLFNKNSSSFYEMRNNPSTLSRGQINIRFLDQSFDEIPSDFIEQLSFTLIIYKPKNKYP
ncbi:MAG: hypothetical protein ACR2M9_00610 [Cyanophyceae cyanobacterium]